MICSTQHDRYALKDYQRLQRLGINTVREGLRWHLIEKRKGRFNFSSVLPMIKASNKTKTQILWDLCHYGWPDHIDILKPDFVNSFGKLAEAFITFVSNETDQLLIVNPINEISYLSWASGEVGYMYPYYYNKGYELKMQLVRAAIEGSERIWGKNPYARILSVDPTIYVTSSDGTLQQINATKTFNQVQYQTRDMLCGTIEPQLGGAMKYLDILGVNYYPFNQWINDVVVTSDEVIEKENYNFFRPFNLLLKDLFERYKRPMFISETGTEGNQRVSWLNYVCGEIMRAMKMKIPIQGLCWYPIVNTLHWDTNRECPNGLFGFVDNNGERKLFEPLANAIRMVNQTLEKVSEGKKRL